MPRPAALLLLIGLLLAALPARAAPPEPEPVPDTWEMWELRQAYRHSRSTAMLGALGGLLGPASIIGGVVIVQTCPLGCNRGRVMWMAMGMTTGGALWTLAAVPLLAAGTMQGAQVVGQRGVEVPRGAIAASITVYSASLLSLLLSANPSMAVLGMAGLYTSYALGLAQLAVTDRWARRALGWHAMQQNPVPAVSLVPLVDQERRGLAITGRF